MNTNRYYIQYEEMPELTSFDAISHQFDYYVPVYRVMKRQGFFRKDKPLLVTRDKRIALDTLEMVTLQKL